MVECGIFGSIRGSYIRAEVVALPRLCVPDALIGWARPWGPPGLTTARRSGAGGGSWEKAFDGGHDSFMAVRSHRPAGESESVIRGSWPCSCSVGT